MAPPRKVSRDEVLAAARGLMVEAGPGALNARALGAALGVSVRPIYSHFASMDDLTAAVYDGLLADYQAALTSTQEGQDRFLDVGLAEIRFARDFPREYRLVHGRFPWNPVQEASVQARTLDHLEREGPYRGFPRAVLADLLAKMAVFTHGLALMVNAGGGGRATDGELRRLLEETGEALIDWARKKQPQEGNR